MDMKIIDFSNIPIGTMVCRSEHCMKERCLKGKPQVGIISDFKIFADTAGNVIWWPVVMWEGASMDSTTHPVLVDLYRKKQKKFVSYKLMKE